MFDYSGYLLNRSAAISISFNKFDVIFLAESLEGSKILFLKKVICIYKNVNFFVSKIGYQKMKLFNEKMNYDKQRRLTTLEKAPFR